MRSFYCNNKEIGSRLVVSKAASVDECDIALLCIMKDMSAEDVFDIFSIVSRKGTCSWVYPKGGEDFYDKVKLLFSATSAEIIPNDEALYKRLEADILEYTQYSVDEFVEVSAKNRGIHPTSVKYLSHVTEKQLKLHSVYTVVQTVLSMLDADLTNFTKFDEYMGYYLEVSRRVGNAEEVFAEKKSHCLSVLTAARQKYFADWEKFEQYTLSVMLKPYGAEEKIRDRVLTIVETINEAR